MEFQGNKLRHELKYYLHMHEYLALRHRISAAMTMDRNSVDAEGYGIRSLYFDGVHQHSLYDKNNGIFRRNKYRIRIYNGSDAKITLERKSKYGDYISKESAPLSKEEYGLILQGDPSCLSAKEHPLLKEFYVSLAHHGFRPSVIVDYTREAYVYEMGNVRVTFDKRLAAGINTVDLFEPSPRFGRSVVSGADHHGNQIRFLSAGRHPANHSAPSACAIRHFEVRHLPGSGRQTF